MINFPSQPELNLDVEAGNGHKIGMTRKEYLRAWYQVNKHRYQGYYRNRKQRNPEAVKAERRRSAERYRENHPDKVAAYRATEKVREKQREYRRKWRRENPEKHAAEVRAYQKRNMRKVLDRQKVWSKAKRKTDLNWKLKCYLRTRIYNALKGKTKSAPTLRLIGCTIENLWLYLESRFEVGMTRQNYGVVWEVDHIIPCALFDLTKEDHQKRCFFFGNLQPLFLADNRSKGAKSETTIERRGYKIGRSSYADY